MELSEPDFQAHGRHMGTVGMMPDWPALHEDNRLMAIPPDRRGCEPQDISRFSLFQYGLEGEGREVVAFVHDDLAIAVERFRKIFLSI